ncbi:MAG: hypothetical protein FWC50_02550 [Planctomycetaceae bacterium]|nr:hypothetical protein [Planctomycetaceae bacterium]
MSNYILPHELEAGATFPACLDNQFVTWNTFQKLVTNPELNYNSLEIQTERKEATQLEFFRSAIYSSQMVINRAFFQNNEFLFNLYGKSADEKDTKAFAKLVQRRIFLPFMMEKGDVFGDGDYTKKPEAGEAFNHLCEYMPNDFPVLVSADDAENVRKANGKLHLVITTWVI